MNPLLFVVTSLLSFCARAAIDIQPHVLEMQQASAVVNVINHGPTTEYITIGLFQINNPGVSPDQESLTFVGEQPQPSLFAVPAKLTLGPKQSGRILLKALQPPDKEQLYRLSVVPEKDLRISGDQGAILGVQLSYRGLVRHLPVSLQPQWTHHCVDGKVKLQNIGNIRLQWHQLKTQQGEIDNFNLYPDQHRQLTASNVQGMIEDKLFSLQCSVS
ncbi:alpha-related fimbriae chaperone 2 [Yersinia thracica]|uniref:Alpha-related fimbriae chaperone 2 n=1 Tax=Yersinia thracica TaxID=2890319 RepID=A0A0T9Q5T6_9GAMM|nr:hypothetical protein [Yersinia thracica]CNH97288.1 alpha-related fimbriae chaperone 2 [Yersinia thracica]